MFKINDITYSLRRYDYLDGNFTQISNDVYKMTNGNEFKIYCYLCSNYNRALGYAFPSLTTISSDTSVGLTTVKKCIKRLEEIGLIKIYKFEEQTSKYANNIYRVYYPIIIKNSLEEAERRKHEEELTKALQEMDASVINKIHTLKKEIETDNEEKENK